MIITTQVPDYSYNGYNVNMRDLDKYANADLSNLSIAGENHFATIDLSNLSRIGYTKLYAFPATCIGGNYSTETGYPDLLTYNGSVISFKIGDGSDSNYAPLTVLFPDGEYKEFTSISNFSSANLADGAYNLFIDREGVIRAFKNHCYSARNVPGDSYTEPYYVTYTGTREATWVRPNLTASGTLGGSVAAISATSSNAGAYNAVDSNLSSEWVSSSSTNSNHQETLIFYNPTPVKITQMKFKTGAWTSREGWSYRYQIGKGTISVSNNNSTWTDVATFNNLWNFTQYVTISLSTKSYFKYYKIHCDALNCYNPNRSYYQWVVDDIDMAGTYQQSYTYQVIQYRVINTSLNEGDVWLCTATKPYVMYQYLNGELEVVNWVRLPQQIVVSNGQVSTVNTIRAYNANGWDEELSTPDYQRRRQITAGSSFTAPTIGYVYNSTGTVSVLLNTGNTYTTSSSGVWFFSPIKGV